MARFLKTFLTLLTITIIGFGLYYYFNNNSKDNNKIDDIKSEAGSQENIEGTVVAKRTTENN